MNQHSRRHDKAFADEVLAEMGRQRLPRKEMERRAGITSSTWGNYVTGASRIPLGAIFAISEALGVLPEEMMRRARLRADGLDPEAQPGSTMAQLEAMLSPAARQVVEEERARLRAERGGGAAGDPPEVMRKGRRSA
jgi:transcriptional regulator with XRE-family HTH domain